MVEQLKDQINLKPNFFFFLFFYHRHAKICELFFLVFILLTK